ncbi:conserved hypothetical protein [Talaromyces stipitatus ATCC 10500]|uniref:FAD-binding domain-containing protein n=1 Tax=Talaromyces stipitatus (strain ATCC 10500 / CBS 375.48 / QM 6759 / NRRL 1006) TaxID=441959 RepID=B8MKF3_TALSN|nr:uncharacterized protein TSTA_047540 [Talaromyces stipitatus ATCC 10500]EED15308.1 conserved hypothetical protein [Talaromyces stipitatus ATCC 10500]
MPLIYTWVSQISSSLLQAPVDIQELDQFQEYGKTYFYIQLLYDPVVVVVGAGPVGLFTALLLAQKGIKVIVYETGSGIDQSPRAVVYFPAVLEEFSKAGILEAVIAAGEKRCEGVDWRDRDGKVIAGIDPPLEDPHYVVVLAQPEFCEVILDALVKTGNAEVHFNHRLQTLQQGDGFVEYHVESRESTLTGKCQYLVGADGGRSTVRRNLGIELEGYTWKDLLFVAVNFKYGLSELGWKAGNFIVDPEDWGVIVKRGKGRSWRIATGIRRAGASTDRINALDEATISVIKKRLCHMLPGDTSQIEYEAFAPYVVHQRCASSYIQGHVILAGDAAHLNNPTGGLGLTTGLLDAAHLGRSLLQILNEGASPELLQSYAETRRRIFREITDPMSTANLLRLHSQKPEDIKKREEFFKNLRDRKDMATILMAGLPDFALTSTSETKFDTYHEVTWFISVTKPDGWPTEKFIHEYKSVHAGMTRQAKEGGSPLRAYIQISNSKQTMKGGVRPEWDYVTRLTFPNLFIVHSSFQDPGYRATAGAHIFCRLGQEGCLARQVAKFSRSEKTSNTSVLMFHNRNEANDEYSQEWFEKRADGMTSIADGDENVVEYVLWRDIAPKNSDYFFRDTQFSGGSWHNYKAVEGFDFVDEDAAAAFLDCHRDEITERSTLQITVVIGEPDHIIRSDVS